MPFSIIPSEEISHRIDFSLLCNARGYLDAVEVGTDIGVFAADFMSRFEGNWFWAVDQYLPVPGFFYERAGDLLMAITALNPYHGRVRFVRMPSVKAAAHAAVEIHPAFVYVDAAHDEESVRADLEAWWDVLSPDGMLAGHDHDPGHPGVCAAVERFARERDLVVRLTGETDSPQSFYMYKREPEVLFHRFFRSGESPNPYFVGAGG